MTVSASLTVWSNKQGEVGKIGQWRKAKWWDVNLVVMD